MKDGEHIITSIAVSSRLDRRTDHAEDERTASTSGTTDMSVLAGGPTTIANKA